MTRASSLNEAALVLRGLPERQAAKILARLEPSDIRCVLGALTRIDRASAKQVSHAFKRLKKESQRWRVDEIIERTAEESEKRVKEAVVTPATSLEQTVEESQPFGFLIDLHPTIRVHVLSDEHPKNIAMVLSLLPPELASETIEALDSELRVSVLRRLCEIDEIQEEEIVGLSFALKLRLKKLLATWYSDATGVNVAAAMLSCTDKKTRETMLELMNQSDPDMAQLLEHNIFRIQTLERLTDEDMKMVLRHVDTSCWAPALKNASVSLQSKVLDNLGPRPAKLLRLEIEEIGMVDSLVQDQARQNVVTEVIRLAREGKIDIRKQDSDRPMPGFPTFSSVQSFNATESIN